MSSAELGDLLERSGQPRIGGMVYRHGQAPAKRSKYNAVRSVDADGLRWDSKRERQRWEYLKMLEANKAIEGLRRQPEYPLIVNKISCGVYKADFIYWLTCDQPPRLVVEDVKGFKTSTYRLKKRIVEALYSITITEIKA